MKPVLQCGDIFEHKDGYLPKQCCASCHYEMAEGYTNTWDYCDADERVDQELCCKVESAFRSMTAEQQKAIVEKFLAGIAG